MHTYKLTLSYKGEGFCGFARQQECTTIQGELERALKVVFRHDLKTVCAGRTDSGVHARAQVVSFDSPQGGLASKSSVRSLNALLDERIAVKTFEEVECGFSARFDAVRRVYRYFICNRPSRSVLAADFCWYIAKPLDVEAMRQASRHLIGEHDFKSFCMAASAVDKPTKREIFDINIFEDEQFGESLLCIEVSGNAFLHSMIRSIVGTLADVGKGKKSADDLIDILSAKDRRAAGENAPAKGLVFWEVEY